jgi:hypothetical protein
MYVSTIAFKNRSIPFLQSSDIFELGSRDRISGDQNRRSNYFLQKISGD